MTGFPLLMACQAPARPQGGNHRHRNDGQSVKAGQLQCNFNEAPTGVERPKIIAG